MQMVYRTCHAFATSTGSSYYDHCGGLNSMSDSSTDLRSGFLLLMINSIVSSVNFFMSLIMHFYGLKYAHCPIIYAPLHVDY